MVSFLRPFEFLVAFCQSEQTLNFGRNGVDGNTRVGREILHGDRFADGNRGTIGGVDAVHLRLAAVGVGNQFKVFPAAEALEADGVHEAMEARGMLAVALVVHGHRQHEETFTADQSDCGIENACCPSAEVFVNDLVVEDELALREEQHASAGAVGQNLGAGIDHSLTAAALRLATFDLHADCADPGSESAHDRVLHFLGLGHLAEGERCRFADDSEVESKLVIGKNEAATGEYGVLAADHLDWTDAQEGDGVAGDLVEPACEARRRRRHVAGVLQLAALREPVERAHNDEGERGP